MSIADFVSIYFTEGINQPFFPEEIGFFGYPIWGMWFIASLGILTQQTTTPRTSGQKKIRFAIFSMFLLAIIWGIVRAASYTFGVI